MYDALFVPQNCRGNVALLERLPKPLRPTLLALSTLENTATLNLHLIAELPWFEGHFPDQPVLPGVVHTHWAALFAQVLFDIPGSFQSINRLKFQNPILPDKHITLTLEHKLARAQVAFKYLHNDEPHSSGSIVFSQQRN